MTTISERYRARALELIAVARKQDDEEVRTALESVASSYQHLAEEADRSSDAALSIEFELPPEAEIDPKLKS